MQKSRLQSIEEQLKKLSHKVKCGTQFYDDFSSFPEVGSSCALYVDKDTGAVYVYDEDTSTYTSADSGLTPELSGTGLNGQVAFWGSPTSLSGSNNLYWDNANNRLGVGTSSPVANIDINTAASPVFKITRVGGTDLRISTSVIATGAAITTATDSPIFFLINNIQRASFAASTGNFILQSGGTFTDNGQRLQVNGATYLAGDTAIGTTTTSGGGKLTVRGSGTTSSTTALLVQNSTPTELFKVLDNGRINQTLEGSSDSTAFGSFALSNTTGAGNTAYGRSVLNANTSGTDNSAFGAYCARLNTGARNSAFGYGAAEVQTTGQNNVFFGHQAGRYITGGSTSLTIANQSIFIGAATRANADNETNQIVIGYQTTGLGSNTTTIGNASTTQTHLYGDLTIGDTTKEATAIVDISSTTKGFLPPRMTTTERNLIVSPAAGLIIFNITTAKLECYDGAVWQAAW